MSCSVKVDLCRFESARRQMFLKTTSTTNISMDSTLNPHKTYFTRWVAAVRDLWRNVQRLTLFLTKITCSTILRETLIAHVMLCETIL